MLCLIWPLLAQAEAPLIVALNADMSAAERMAGESIRHGAQTAIDEINAAGGVLGLPFTHKSATEAAIVRIPHIALEAWHIPAK